MFAWRALPPAGDRSTATMAEPGAYLTMSALESAGIRAAFTTRRGGSSDGAHATLNLSFLAGDEARSVRANRRRVLAALGADPSGWTSGQQVHGAAVAQVGREQRGSGADDPATVVAGVDALWTDEPGAALAVLTADCVPMLLADPHRRRIGVVHAGWRGMVAGVVAGAVEAMGHSDEMTAFVGPAIGPCCYEVGPEVAEEARAALGTEVVRERPGHRSHLDLWRGAAVAARAAGVGDVRLTALCTKCENHRFYSHRGGDTGRQGLVALLEDRKKGGDAHGRSRG